MMPDGGWQLRLRRVCLSSSRDEAKGFLGWFRSLLGTQIEPARNRLWLLRWTGTPTSYVPAPTVSSVAQRGSLGQ